MSKSFSLLALVLTTLSGCTNPNPQAPSSVSQKVQSVTVTGGNEIKGRNYTLQLHASVALAGGATSDATNTAVWSSSNAGVASVSANGLVTSVALGATEIAADVQGIRGRFMVAVTPLRIAFEAVSAGALAGRSYGGVQFTRNGTVFYTAGGGGPGRGFNVAMIDTTNGELIRPVETFDTWLDPLRLNMLALNTRLGSVPDRSLVLIAVSDEAGLNRWDSCDRYDDPTTENARQALEALGAARIRAYCYRGSWSMIAVKGVGSKDEQLSTNTPVISTFILEVE